VQGVRQPSTPCCCCCLLALNTAGCCWRNPSEFPPKNDDENPGSGALAAGTVEVRIAKTSMGRRRRAQVISLFSDHTF